MAEQTYRFMWGGAIPGEPFKALSAEHAVCEFIISVRARSLAGLGTTDVRERMQVFRTGTWKSV